MNLLVNKEINIEKWNDLLQCSGFASPFQSPAFFRFINAIPDLSAQVFAVESMGSLVALMLVVIHKEKGIKRLFSRRGIIYGGPLLRDDDQKALKFLIENTAEALKYEVIYLETRNFFNYNYLRAAFVEVNWQFVPWLNFQINTSGKTIDNLLSTMKYNRRREIKLSLKNGAEFCIASNFEEVKEVYSILHELYRERVKLPLPDLDFFKAFMEADIARVFVVKFENQIIAGSFCLFYPHKNVYTLYYCGLREIEKKIFPTSLAVYAVLDFAVKEQIPVVDLMGAGKPGEEYGVRDYKSQFGGELVEYGRFLKVLNPVLYSIGRFGLKMMTKFSL